MMSFGTVPGCRQQKKWLSTDAHRDQVDLGLVEVDLVEVGLEEGVLEEFHLEALSLVDLLQIQHLQELHLSTDVDRLEKGRRLAFRETVPCVDLSTGDLSMSTGTPCQEPVCSVCADLSTGISGAVDRYTLPVPYKICLCRAVDRA
ncbi:hypothetical protein Taro_000987 [Colocasia esculenta]|uniref:Uncharacterized protein n=1 Tax=Colocasia esculenta TaxID=4460 RepID=A0A843TJD5_COLES|nr:hypothetical protein [Colocasia esculenta]